MSKTYDEQDSSTWLDFWDIVSMLEIDFVERFADLDARQISSYINSHASRLQEPCTFGNHQCTMKEVLVACKLACPTLYLCNYFFRDQTQGTHMGIDIIMPA